MAHQIKLVFLIFTIGFLCVSCSNSPQLKASCSPEHGTDCVLNIERSDGSRETNTGKYLCYEKNNFCSCKCKAD